MSITHQVAAEDFTAMNPADFLQSVEDRPDALIYFLCNVGDGDTQVLLLPADETTGLRQAIVVDVFQFRKAAAILDWATGHGLMSADDERDIALVVATHPHQDHIGGMARLLEVYGDRTGEFWDPGYFHTIGAYHDMMRNLAANGSIGYAHPSSGLRRWFGNVAVTVLSPSIALRNRFDTYGVDINDASISLQIDFPLTQVVQRDNEGNRVESGHKHNILVLGADAQTLSWAQVISDFPRLRKSNSAAAKAIGAATGTRDPLRAGLHKVPHHGSKHGVNLELAERIHGALTLVSSVRGGGVHGFPHQITQHILRESVNPQAKKLGAHDPADDPSHGLYYTGDEDTNGKPLGTIAVVMRAGKLEMWRFGDTPSQTLNLDSAQPRRLSKIFRT